MSGKALSYLFLFVASLGLGVAVGEWFFHLFLIAVPPVALSQFNAQAAHVTHWLYGAGVGVAMFVWAMIAIAINRLSSMGSKKAQDA